VIEIRNSSICVTAQHSQTWNYQVVIETRNLKWFKRQMYLQL